MSKAARVCTTLSEVTTARSRHYRARYYDQTAGHFLSEDPRRFYEGTNFFAYADNNPALNVDPTGLSVEVRCLNVQQGSTPGGYGIWFGVTHCRVHVTSEGNCTSLEWNGANSVGLDGLESKNQCYINGYTAKVSPGRPCGGFEKCILSHFKWYEEHPQHLGTYNPQWNNSNMFIQQLIQGCGGRVHFPNYVFWYFPQNRIYGGSLSYTNPPQWFK